MARASAAETDSAAACCWIGGGCPRDETSVLALVFDLAPPLLCGGDLDL